jgi:mannosyltransferase OCH1-like enzyme
MSQEYTFKLKENYNSIIPLKIYQTWHTKNLPKHMNDTVELLKNTNPEFEHFLFDDNDCRNFIKNNFNEKVLHTFNKLKPGAYKADLWRYCVLYIN